RRGSFAGSGASGGRSARSGPGPSSPPFRAGPASPLITTTRPVPGASRGSSSASARDGSPRPPATRPPTTSPLISPPCRQQSRSLFRCRSSTRSSASVTGSASPHSWTSNDFPRELMSYENTAEPVKLGYLFDFRLPEYFPKERPGDHTTTLRVQLYG